MNDPQDLKNTEETIVVDTAHLDDGQTKCEACGSTDIALNVATGMLRCNFCRHEQEGAAFEKSVSKVRKLKGQIVGAGAANISASTDDVLTFKCESCSAEVIVETSESTQARCHWCRNTLSVNEQIPNGAVPDKVLPFSVIKSDACQKIQEFVNERQFFAQKRFKKEFTVDNVIGVYLPYMVVDANVGMVFKGEGEIELRTWTEERIETRMVQRTVTRGSGNNQREETIWVEEQYTVIDRFYDADRFKIVRDFDMFVEDMTIESSAEKIKHRSLERTNNIISAIKPFDVSKGRAWDANYMNGFNAQKRDVNIDDLIEPVEMQLKDVARLKIRKTIREYQARGVRWTSEKLKVQGKQWTAAYFPIWLYSFQERDKTVNYIAVNGQTGKMLGSVPLNFGKLLLVSLLSGAFFTIPTYYLSNWFFTDVMLWDPWVTWMATALMFLFSFGIPYVGFFSIYRNDEARFEHETEIKAKIRNMKKKDTVIEQLRRTKASKMPGRNNTSKVKYKGKK